MNKKKSGIALTKEEVNEIIKLESQGMSINEIIKETGRTRTTIMKYSELNANDCIDTRGNRKGKRVRAENGYSQELGIPMYYNDNEDEVLDSAMSNIK